MLLRHASPQSYTVACMDRAALIRRLKAARMLGSFPSPQALADHPLLVDNGIKESRIRELESPSGRGAEARPMELEVIARACEVPEDFFYAPLDRLEHPSAGERIQVLEREVGGLTSAVESLVSDVTLALDELAASRMTQAVRGAAQATEQPDAASPPVRRATEQP